VGVRNAKICLVAAATTNEILEKSLPYRVVRNMESVGCNDKSIYNPGKKGRDYICNVTESLLDEASNSYEREIWFNVYSVG
jgi:hypothetical protein